MELQMLCCGREVRYIIYLDYHCRGHLCLIFQLVEAGNMNHVFSFSSFEMVASVKLHSLKLLLYIYIYTHAHIHTRTHAHTHS